MCCHIVAACFHAGIHCPGADSRRRQFVRPRRRRAPERSTLSSTQMDSYQGSSAPESSPSSSDTDGSVASSIHGTESASATFPTDVAEDDMYSDGDGDMQLDSSLEKGMASRASTVSIADTEVLDDEDFIPNLVDLPAESYPAPSPAEIQAEPAPTHSPNEVPPVLRGVAHDGIERARHSKRKRKSTQRAVESRLQNQAISRH
jgi:hypothetical protein